MKTYYDILRELREDHDLTQCQLAKVLKTTQQVYSRYENGTNELPLHHLVTLCRFYQISADYILGIGNYSDGQNATEYNETESANHG